MAIHVTPIPRLTTFVAPAFTLGTSNVAGNTAAAVASNSTLLAFDATVPGNIVASTAANAGSAAVASRRDHTHGTVDALAQCVTGSYSGDAASSQAITGVGVLAKLIFISKRNTAATASEGFSMSSTAIFDNNSSGYSYDFGINAYGQFVAGKLTALGTDGFTVSNDVTTNGSLNGAGNTYDYTIIGY